jgi:hypothetical protein
MKIILVPIKFLMISISYYTDEFPIKTSPEEGFKIPVIILINVVLPAPL